MRQALAAEAGIRLKRFDKKAERAALAAHRAALSAQLEGTESPSDALLIAVPLVIAEARAPTTGNGRHATALCARAAARPLLARCFSNPSPFRPSPLPQALGLAVALPGKLLGPAIERLGADGAVADERQAFLKEYCAACVEALQQGPQSERAAWLGANLGELKQQAAAAAAGGVARGGGEGVGDSAAAAATTTGGEEKEEAEEEKSG